MTEERKRCNVSCHSMIDENYTTKAKHKKSIKSQKKLSANNLHLTKKEKENK